MERAAIVYAFTYDTGGGRPKSGEKSSLTISDFADLGLAGLTSRDTVRDYRPMWAEHGDPDVGPGSRVTIPVIDFPPQGKNLGSRMPADP